MSRGKPDWGDSALTSGLFELKDLAELAARLGSVVSFDRGGKVIFIEDWNQGMQRWLVTYTGGTGSFQLTTGNVFSPPLAAVMTPHTDATDTITITALTPATPSQSLGLESVYQDVTNVKYFEMHLRVYDGSVRHDYAIRWDRPNTKVQYYDSAGVWQDIAIISGSYPTIAPYIFLKMIVDEPTPSYRTLRLDDTDYDLSAYAAREVASGIRPHYMIWFVVENNAAATVSPQIDRIILTQEE